MLSRVLVPLDGSSLGRTALDFTERIVSTQCELNLLTVVQETDIPVYGTSPMVIVNPEYAILDNAYELAERHLIEVAQTLRERGFHVSISVQVGDPVQLIVQAAESLNVDMIIMATHGRSGIDRWLHGSVTGRVMGMTSRPVLVVTGQKHQHNFQEEIAKSNFVWAL